MAAAHVQAAIGYSASSASPTRAFGSNVTAGNAICGFVGWDSQTITLTSVTDNLGNSYTLLNNPTTNIIWRAAMFYAKNIAGGACTLTFHFSSAITSEQVFHEVSGVDTSSPLDGNNLQSQDNIGSGTDAATSPSITTTAAGDYIFGGCTEVSSGSRSTGGTGFTVPANSTSQGGAFTLLGEYLIQGAAGSIAATATMATGSGNYTFTGVLALKAAAGGETITMDKWSNRSAELISRRLRGMVPSGTINIKT